MKRTASILSLLAIISMATACASTATTRALPHNADQALALAIGSQPGELHAQPDAISRVELVTTPSAARPTEFLGVLEVPARTALDASARQALRERAAGIDADAVVSVAYRAGTLSGVAVRYRTMVHTDRAYDVVGELEVEGRDDDAMSRLCAHARAVHADVLMNVGLEDDPTAPGQVRLRGTAVRYR